MHTQHMTNELIPSVNLDRLLALRDALLSHFQAARAAVEQAREVWKATPFGYNGTDYRGQPEQYNMDIVTDRAWCVSVERAMARIDAQAWLYITKEAGIASLMDAQKWEKWQVDMYKADVPAFTRENVLGTFDDLSANKGRIFAEGVINAFKRVMGSRWAYATNDPFKFGDKIVIERIHEFGMPQINAMVMNDLSRVAHVLDGKPAPDYRQSISVKAKSVKDAHPNDPRAWTAADDYLRVKFFKNGNAHVVFTREDILAKINQILAHELSNALPDGLKVHQKRR